MSKKKSLIIALIILIIIVPVQIYFLSIYDHFKAEGGLKVELGINPEDVTRKFARASLDFDFVMKDAVREHEQNGEDFLAVLAESNKKRLQRPLVRLFNYKEISELDMSSTDDEVIDFLRSSLESNLDAAAYFYEERMEKVSGISPVVSYSAEELSMTIKLPGHMDSADASDFYLPKVDIGFFECAGMNEIGSFWQTACLLTEPDSIPESEWELTNLNKSSAGNAQTLATTVNWGPEGFGIVQDRDKKYVEEIIQSSAFDSLVPKRIAFRWSRKSNFNNQGDMWSLYAIKLPRDGRPKISNEDIHSASFEEQDAYGQPTLSIRMTQDGADKWAKMTEENVGRIIAMSVNEVIFSAPNVINPIMDGNTQLSGGDPDKLKEIETALSYRSLEITPVFKNQTIVKGDSPMLNSVVQTILLVVSALTGLFFLVQYFRRSRQVE